MSDVAALVAQVDWTRMAAPQADGYDTSIILRLAAAAEPPLRSSTPDPSRRPRLAESTAGIGQAPQLGLMSNTIVPAASDHPNLAAAARYLGCWPAAYEQFKRLIDTIFPYTDLAQAAQGDWSLGSSSHSYDTEWGCIHATVDDALGLAQALIHETAHQKLNALGLRGSSAYRLVVNDPGELYAHPHFVLRRKPMTAVFHEQYSFIHVAALDLHMLEASSNETERHRILMLLARNIPRLEAEHDEIGKNIRTDGEGTIFIKTFMNWSTDVLVEGRLKLDSNGYGTAAR